MTLLDGDRRAGRRRGRRRRAAAAPVPVRRHRLRRHRPRERRARWRAAGRRRAVRGRLPRPVRVRDPAVLLGPLRARAGPARHGPDPGGRRAGSPERGVEPQGPPAVLAHGDRGLADRPAGGRGHRRPARPHPARRRRLRRPHRRVGRDQRGRDHARVRPRRERHHEDGAAPRAGGDRRGDVRRGARDQPARHAPAQRLRHVARLRAPDRGVPGGRDPDRRARAAVAHAPGLLGRREDARRSSSASRASGCRSTSPRARSCPAT